MDDILLERSKELQARNIELEKQIIADTHTIMRLQRLVEILNPERVNAAALAAKVVKWENATRMSNGRTPK